MSGQEEDLPGEGWPADGHQWHGKGWCGAAHNLNGGGSKTDGSNLPGLKKATVLLTTQPLATQY